jgi:hypothetical protein
LTITPTTGYLGTSRITFTLSDSTYSNITKNIYVTVTHVNGPPIFTSNYLANVSLLEDGSFVGVVKAVDLEYDTLTYSATSNNDSIAVSVKQDTMTIVPILNWYGTGTISVYAKDTENAADTLTVSVTVVSVNDPPVVNAGQTALNFDEDTEYKYSITYSDVENDKILKTTKTSNFITISLTETSNNALDISIMPKPNWNGVTDFTLLFSDDSTANNIDDGDTTAVTYTVTVNPVNDKPTVFTWLSPAEVDTISILESDTRTKLLKWTISRDVDGDSIKYFITMPGRQIVTVTDDSILVPYADFSDLYWPAEFFMLPRITGKISLAVTDGNDTIPAANTDRTLFINRYSYLGVYKDGVPTEFALHENYPNPFNPTTTLRFDLPEVSSITLTIYNMLGQRVRTLNMNDTPAGYHSIKWDATNDYGEQVGAGVYLYQLRANQFVKTRKMILLK